MNEDNNQSASIDSTSRMQDRRFPPIFMDNALRRIFFPPKKLVSKYVLRGQVVADLGCGPGYFTLPLAEIVSQKKGGKVYAVDFDERSIERLKKKAIKRGCEKTIDACVSSASSLAFIPDSSVDFVFAYGLLCCMRDHLGAVAEIKRILKKEPNDRGSAYLSITKFARKSDTRALRKDEWRKLISTNFNILKQEEGLTTRWVLVSPNATANEEENGEANNDRRIQSLTSFSNCCWGLSTSPTS